MTLYTDMLSNPYHMLTCSLESFFKPMASYADMLSSRLHVMNVESQVK